MALYTENTENHGNWEQLAENTETWIVEIDNKTENRGNKSSCDSKTKTKNKNKKQKNKNKKTKKQKTKTKQNKTKKKKKRQQNKKKKKKQTRKIIVLRIFQGKIHH